MRQELTATEARARLVAMLQPDSVPTLTSAEVDLLLEMAKRTDAYGVEYDETGWEPTWNLSSAAADGWAMKAAKVASEFNVEAGSVKANRNEVYQACMDMSKRFRASIIGSLRAGVSV